jgi:uncharacterized protein YkwD
MRTCLRSWFEVVTPGFIAALLAMIIVLTQHNVEARQQKPQPKIGATELARLIHQSINEQRRKHKLPALAWSDALSRIAEKHSRHMADKDYFDHVSPDGKRFPDRYRQAGYVCEVIVGDKIHAGAENIALSRLYNSTTTENRVTYYQWNSAREIASKTVEGWMNSAGHRENILTRHWWHAGIGIVIAPGNRVYITQNFC